MTLWCCISPERVEKTTWIMEALAEGWPGAEIVEGEPPDDGEPFAVWGQRWLTERILPGAIRQRRPFWHIDNGFWHPSNGSKFGYYRFTYCGMSSVLLNEAPGRPLAAKIQMQPWRHNGRNIVLALPGETFGAAAGMDMRNWISTAYGDLRRYTKRPVITREKGCWRPLRDDLRDAWALVTHSSNVAVEAAVAGIPVFVMPTSPAAPVGNFEYAEIDRPAFPDRSAWWSSLMAQQFTLSEMRSGEAYRCLKLVEEQVNGRHLRSHAADAQRPSSAADWGYQSAE